MNNQMKAALGNNTHVSVFHILGFSGSPLLELLFFILCLTIYTMTLLGNGLIVFLTLSNPALQTPMYFFLRNLSFMELCYSSITMPRILTSYVTGNNKISFTGCAVQMCFFLLLGCAECYILGAMAYDRYVAVCHPLRYMAIMDKCSCTLLVVGSWMSGFPVSSVQTTLTFSSPFCGPNEINHFFCDIPPVLRLVCADTSQIEMAMLIITVVIIIAPFMLILISYAHIIAAVVRMSSSESRQKAISTCSSHLLVVTLFYGSAMTVYLCPQSSGSSENDKVLSLFYTMVTPMVNPMIYCLRNKEVKAALWKTVGFQL
uniref:olfactory receptor 10A4-like n=1 Tax=Euleptes europaea TaxID=460621 RepID=UPI00254222AC|nr:olfactory receptor 10A4-like [Euleptes europaea]